MTNADELEEEEDLEFAPIDRRALRVAPVTSAKARIPALKWSSIHETVASNQDEVGKSDFTQIGSVEPELSMKESF